ncbi:hypothetical protein AVEN_214319-1 [Araneus ventricosus]|uniref:Uncharacterized protein n=1 Tax=Araneus ventricosus TaxID=182803 RepID=A0A4Y2WJG2_ARAVE|nr:hypothetical protein AVEN_179532-1 [Araneus ventricosus]GBO36715.1 hypothetical protein AVEN_200471-1 [Araneus ventricosus]GBO36732.1 hypothetical protein AVEN_54241-1 [Araneus ventricosus]GBO36734.1 hypothetical protein AVEN_214319-1 [Araneus ventricosus]
MFVQRRLYEKRKSTYHQQSTKKRKAGICVGISIRQNSVLEQFYIGRSTSIRLGLILKAHHCAKARNF